MLNQIAEYFRELFKNDLGKFNPKASKVDLKSVLYWVFGLIFSFVIPACLVYLEVGQFNWNVIKFIWGEEAQALLGNGLYRGGYFICGLCANISLLLAGFLSTYRVNGKSELLSFKKISRVFFILCLPLAIICFILATILY